MGYGSHGLSWMLFKLLLFAAGSIVFSYIFWWHYRKMIVDAQNTPKGKKKR